jgi:hypothetical protein
MARDRRGGKVAFRIVVVLVQAEQAAPAEVPLHTPHHPLQDLAHLARP